MNSWVTPRNAVVVALIAIMALLPVYAAASGNSFTMTLFTRIIILAIAAVSLNATDSWSDTMCWPDSRARACVRR